MFDGQGHQIRCIKFGQALCDGAFCETGRRDTHSAQNANGFMTCVGNERSGGNGAAILGR